MPEPQTPEGVSVALPNDATDAQVIDAAFEAYPTRRLTGRVLHVSDPDEPEPGKTEYVFEVEP